MSLSIHDVEKLQALYPAHQIELREGKISIMSRAQNLLVDTVHFLQGLSYYANLPL